ncbi:putative XPA-binding protein 2 [Danaus plexippus plexippus]|uniref:XPA-binding protein 2 n=1 Tax=Danaus plexippus plexippus TaxID=278856 RepID=A0A212ES65_DANPL|nr:putative XPA-binding protein 2 [Danaus plexippus plexippus]
MPVLDGKEIDIFFSEEDLPYEEEILRNPFSVRHWLRYIEHKKAAPKYEINIIYERALKELPGSFKLWYNYLKLRRKQIRGRCITDPAYEDVNNCFERSLVFMHKMPRIWMDYCTFLTDQWKITATRKAFDSALRALPITQHHRIWPLYLNFLKKHNIPETAVRVFRRYLKLCPEDTEEYIDYLISIEKLDEAALKLAQLVNNENFQSKHGKSNHQLWNELCELISKNPDKIHSLNVDAIIRGGLRRYTDQLGHLWNSLADYYVRSGLFERARDIYEEAIQTVTTVRDFTQVFDAYAQFEELSLSKKMEEVAKKPNPTEDEDIDLELRLARFEYLMERRLLLLNSVLLRQNPHNIAEWHKRVKLYEGKPHEIIDTYTEAVQTVDPKLAVGKLYTLWVGFAKFYESNDQIDDARLIFEKATQAAEIYGVPKTRQIYEKAIETLPDEKAREMCLRFSEMETKLGEIDRARAIYAHCSQMCDPRITTEFWNTWKEFEVRHGNEDTMREMLRIKRSVQATYNTQVNMMSAQMLGSAAQAAGTISDLAPGMKDGMRLLEAKAAEMAVQSKGNILFVRGETQGLKENDKVVNPDEIDIDDEESDNSNDDEEVAPVQKKEIPAAVFGGLVPENQ